MRRKDESKSVEFPLLLVSLLDPEIYLIFCKWQVLLHRGLCVSSDTYLDPDFIRLLIQPTVFDSVGSDSMYNLTHCF